MKGQHGQILIEYVLLLAVAVAIASSVFDIIKNSDLLSDDGTCSNPNSDYSLVCQVKKLWDKDTNFRYFTVVGH